MDELERLKRENKRLKRMISTASQRLLPLLDRPCLDHDCLEHAWWDPDCDHTACTMLLPKSCVTCGHQNPHDRGGIGVCSKPDCGCDGPVLAPVERKQETEWERWYRANGPDNKEPFPS